MAEYEVIVGNIGKVHTGGNKREALKHFREYCGQSRSGRGRAGDESVTLFIDGEPKKEFTPRVTRTFELKITLGNDAMRTGEDVALALRAAADDVSEQGYLQGDVSCGILDANGNSVGRWAVKERRWSKKV